MPRSWKAMKGLVLEEEKVMPWSPQWTNQICFPMRWREHLCWPDPDSTKGKEHWVAMERNLWLADPGVTSSLLSKGHQWSLEDTQNAVRSCQVTLSDSHLRAIKCCKPFISCRGERKWQLHVKLTHYIAVSLLIWHKGILCLHGHLRSEYSSVLPFHSFIPDIRRVAQKWGDWGYSPSQTAGQMCGHVPKLCSHHIY